MSSLKFNDCGRKAATPIIESRSAPLKPFASRLLRLGSWILTLLPTAKRKCGWDRDARRGGAWKVPGSLLGDGPQRSTARRTASHSAVQRTSRQSRPPPPLAQQLQVAEFPPTKYLHSGSVWARMVRAGGRVRPKSSGVPSQAAPWLAAVAAVSLAPAAHDGRHTRKSRDNSRPFI